MWTEWSEFGACSVTCNGGTQERTRECTNPAPEFGGADCIGDAMESQVCGTDPCPGENLEEVIDFSLESQISEALTVQQPYTFSSSAFLGSYTF